MAVRSSEAFVTVTGELASRLTLALPVGAADIGGNVAHPLRRVIGGHSHGAAVNHCKTGPGSARAQRPARDPRSRTQDPGRLLSQRQVPQGTSGAKMAMCCIRCDRQSRHSTQRRVVFFCFEAFSPCGAEQLMHAGPIHPSCYIRQLCWKLTDEEERLSPPLRGTHGCRTDLQNLWAEPPHTATGASYIQVN